MINSEIIESIRKGSMKAFEVFFEEYYLKVRNFAFGMVKSMDEAENIAQNVFMKIWINRFSLSAGKSLDSYVFTIARNEIYDCFRDVSYFSRYTLSVRTGTPSSRLGGTENNDVSSEYDIKEISRIVNDTVAHMPEQRRRIFRMSRQLHLTNDEIAERLNLSKRTVERHISLALATIRERLGDFLFWLFFFFIS